MDISTERRLEAAEAFAAKCKGQGVSIGIKLSELMSLYTEDNR